MPDNMGHPPKARFGTDHHGSTPGKHLLLSFLAMVAGISVRWAMPVIIVKSLNDHRNR